MQQQQSQMTPIGYRKPQRNLKPISTPMKKMKVTRGVKSPSYAKVAKSVRKTMGY